MTKVLLSTLSLLLMSFQAFASPQGLVIEGQLTDSLGQTPIEAASVSFLLKVYSPGIEQCLLYEETHTLNMTDSGGFFSLVLGGGVQSGSDYHDTSTLPQILDNSATIIADACAIGSTYTPASDDTRKLEVSYDDGNGLQTLSQMIDLHSSAYAMNAGSIGGVVAADLLVKNTSGSYQLDQTNLEWVFDGAQFTELQALINGTSTQYHSGTPTANVDMNSQNVINVADPTAANDAANKNYVDIVAQSIAGSAADVGTISGLGAGDSGKVMQWNGTQWTAAASGAPITTVFGRTGDVMAMPGDYQAYQVNNAPSGNVVAGDVQGAIDELDTEKLAKNGDSMTGHLTMDTNGEIRFSDADDSHYVGFVAPATVTAGASFVWTLPADDGAANDVLQTDGSGNLSWAPMSGGSVTSITAGIGLDGGTITTSGSISIANDGVNTAQLADDAVTNVKLADNSVDVNKLANDSVDSTKIMDGSISAADLLDDYVNVSGDVLTGNLGIIGGAHASPGLYFSGDTDTGLASTATDKLELISGGAAVMTIDNGQVGIGTNFPQHELDIRGSAAAGIGMRIQNNNGGSDRFKLTVTGTGDASSLPSGRLKLAGSSDAIPFLVVKPNGHIGIGSNDPQALFDVDGALAVEAASGEGKLGINDNTPSATVDIKGHSTAIPLLRIRDNASTLVMEVDDSGHVGVNRASPVATLDVKQYSSEAMFAVHDNGDNPKLIVSSSGQVGVGTNTPTAQLHVDGAILPESVSINAGMGCSAGENGHLINDSSTKHLLQCDGTIWKKVAGPHILPSFNVSSANPIDFVQGFFIESNLGCNAGAIDLHNLKDGAEYKLLLTGGVSGTCSFNAFSDAGTTGLTVKLPGNHGATTAASWTLYEFMVFGGNVIVKFTPGYN